MANQEGLPFPVTLELDSVLARSHSTSQQHRLGSCSQSSFLSTPQGVSLSLCSSWSESLIYHSGNVVIYSYFHLRSMDLSITRETSNKHFILLPSCGWKCKEVKNTIENIPRVTQYTALSKDNHRQFLPHPHMVEVQSLKNKVKPRAKQKKIQAFSEDKCINLNELSCVPKTQKTSKSVALPNRQLKESVGQKQCLVILSSIYQINITL